MGYHSRENGSIFQGDLEMGSYFYGIEYIHVVRDKNQVADALSKLGSSWAQIPHEVSVQDLVKPSVRDDLVEKENSEEQFVCTV